MKKIIQFFKDALFPRRCMVCEKIIEPGKNFCEECKYNVQMLPLWYDIKRGISITDIYFDDISAPFLYENSAKDIMTNFKFHGMKENGEYLGEKMYEVFSAKYKDKFDGIIYVPTTRKRYVERGFNSAEVLAKYFSEYSKIPLLHNVLVRNNKSRTQHNLSYFERKQNAEISYDLGKNPIGKGKYILIDDICTSGFTLNYICKLIKDSGADKVICITACVSGNNSQK